MLPRLGAPSRAVIFAVKRASPLLENSTAGFELFKHLHPAAKSPVLAFVRHSTSRSQASVNRGKDGPGKRLGAKKTGEQYVIPGNIIFRQRGSLWFPGENCGMGRDHTIYALQAGYVKYYLDPEKHPKRKYIGVVFERDQKLPLPRNSARRRRLGRVVATISEPISEPVQEEAETVPDVAATKNGKKGKTIPKPELQEMRPGYMYRESNWEIGRTAEKRGVYVKPFKPRDRWAAWRKSTIRKAKNAEKRGFRRAAK